jgi:hypothetical protein
MIKSLKSPLLCLLACLLTLVGCSSHQEQQDTSDASVSINIQSLSSSDVQRVTLGISGSNIPSVITYDLSRVGNRWTGIVHDIPVGDNRTFHAQAFDQAGTLLYEGSALGIAITKGQTVAVVLVLQRHQESPPFTNTAPFIDSLVVSSSTVEPSATVSLNAVAHDEDTNDTLTYKWTASAGTFAASNSSAPIWTAPATPGRYELTLTVSDGRGGSRSVTLSIDVRSYAASGSARVDISFNAGPQVARVTATPTRLNVGGSTSLEVSASDGDGDSLSYKWSHGGGECTGVFNNPQAQNPLWTAPSVAPAGGRCTLVVTVSDGRGGTNTGTLTLWVGAPETINFAPEVVSSYQSTDEYSAGDVLLFRVRASDPEGQVLTFTWGANRGTLAAPTPISQGSEIHWTAPTDCQPVSIHVKVRDPLGVEVVRNFAAQPRSGCNSAYTTVLLHMDGANASRIFTDVKGHKFTANGNIQLSTAQSRFGGASAFFDGSGSHLTSDESLDFNFTDGQPFTVETWVNGTGIIFGNDTYGLGMQITSSYELRLWIADVLPWTWEATLAGRVPAGWHHVALSYDGRTYRTFVDGVLSFNVSGQMKTQTYNRLQIGSYSSGTKPFFTGFMDEFRLTRGIALYTKNFSIPTEPFPNP